MTDIDSWVQQRRRESIKDKRLEYYRMKVTFEETDRDSDEWDRYHAIYQNRVSAWVWGIHAALKQWADAGKEPYREIWQDRQYEEYTGLAEVFETPLRGSPKENLLEPETLHQLGNDLEKISVLALDLPEQPPVVDEPWSPDEVMSQEEAEQRIEEIKENQPDIGDLDGL